MILGGWEVEREREREREKQGVAGLCGCMGGRGGYVCGCGQGEG